MAKSLLNNIINGIKHQFNVLSQKVYDKDHGLNLVTIKYLKHLPNEDHPRSIKLKYGKINYRFATDLFYSLDEIFKNKIYKQELNENSYILDCGANIGLSAVYIKSICQSAHIELFEPDAANFELLSHNIRSCGLTGITAHQKAVWTENATLNFKNEGTVSSRIEQQSTPSTTTVEAVRLRDFMTREIDFLKMDIEGAEYPVVKDIEDKLYLVKNFFLEYHGKFEENGQLIELLEIVRRNNFRFYIMEAGPVYRTPFYRIADDVNRAYDVQLNIFCFRD